MTQRLALARPVIFPLIGITPDRKCACSEPSCTRIGKHPAVRWGEVEFGTQVPKPAPGAGYGIRTGAYPQGSDVFVVDLDGVKAAELFDDLGDCPDTFTVTSPRKGGGWHLYFRHPGFYVKNSSGKLGAKSLTESSGIDIRGDGGFVVGPGSPHKSGGTYYVSEDFPVAEAPDWLLDWLEEQSQGVRESQYYPGDVEPGTAEHAYRRRIYADYLKTAEPCVQGKGGDEQLFRVVQRGAYDYELPVDDVLELIAEHFDPRCDPPWGDELEARVIHKAHDAKESSTREQAPPLPECLAAMINQPSVRDLDFTAIDATPQNEAKPSETLDTGAITASVLGEIWGGWDEIILPPPYMLEGMIPEATVFTFFAEGGSLKTWAMLSLAIAVATGEPWLGELPVKKGKVLYLDYEDGRYEFQRRVRMMTGGKDIPNLGYLYCGPDLLKPALWTEIAKMGLTLVIVDSLGAGTPSSIDENSPAFADGVKVAGRFTTATGCTVGFIHHANKSGGMRGSSAVRDQSDVVFGFEKVSETDTTKRMRMICDKPGPQRKPKPVNLELSDDGICQFTDEVEEMGRNARTPKEIREAILLALKNGPIGTSEEIREAIGGRKQAVCDEVKILSTRGDIRKIEGEGYVLNDEAAQKARVLAQVRAFDGWKTPGRLAEAAYVTTRFVHRLMDRGVIGPRSTGPDAYGFLVLDDQK